MACAVVPPLETRRGCGGAGSIAHAASRQPRSRAEGPRRGRGVLREPDPSDGLPDLPSQGLGDRLRPDGSGVQDGHRQAHEERRHALGRRRGRSHVPPACSVRQWRKTMGRLLASQSRLNKRSTHRSATYPADSVIWLVIAMALFAADSIPQVWRRLLPTRDHPEPTDSAFSQARRRLGVAPLRHLFLETAGPMATHQTIGAFYRGWRLMGLDGTTLDLPDTPDNARTFGRPTTGRAEGAFPQVRLLALCELGTHAVCSLAIKPLCPGEPSMVGPLLEHLGPGMLLIWDRGFFSYELISAVVRRGAHLLARVKSNTVLRPI